MDKNENVFDKIARQQAETRALAESAKRLWYKINTMPQQELLSMFKAICSAGGDEYDPNMHYRRKILRALRDEYLPDLIGVSVPVRLAWEIERRLWIVEKEPPGPTLSGNVDVEEVPD